MRAIVISRPGPVEVLEFRDLPAPQPEADELLIDVHAFALNRADLLQRRGLYPAPQGVHPQIPGLEISGLRHDTQDPVMALLAGGGYAEQVAVPRGQVMPLPRGIALTEAAAIPEAFITAYDAVVLQARVRPQQRVLIQAAASGVGLAAAQLARRAGAFVIGLTRSAPKRERLLATPWFDQVDEPSMPNVPADSLDVVIDFVGQHSFAALCSRLRTGARWIMLGTMSGAKVELDLWELMRRRASIHGSVLRSRTPDEKGALVAAFWPEAAPAFERGELKPIIDRMLDWSQIQDAHRALESNETVGKIVVTIDRKFGAAERDR
jgi:NADPH:quinone reductase-like Zn-dependent oxidoreductase